MGAGDGVSIPDEFGGIELMRIGLEIHVQLPTKSKLFCSCPNTVSDEPNTTVCPTCLGMPGSKPTLNKRALELAAIAAKTLNCRLLETTWFSRKTYFYPDLSKNFQITQFEAPIGVDGYLDISQRMVRISRVHLEEDPARAVHELVPEQESSLLDYNRSGVPLIEIVTEPDMLGPSEAREFLRLLLDQLRYVGVLTEGGELKIRADGNISVTDGERVEIKNITGLKNLEKALEFEFHRQQKVSKAGIEIKRETRGFDEERGVTTALREKEEEKDYGFIFEPDLPIYDLSTFAKQMDFPPTALEKATEIQKKHGLSVEKVEALLLDSRPVGELLENMANRVDPARALRWLSTVVKAEHYRHPERNITELAGEIEKVISADASGKISDVVAKAAIRRIFETGEAGEMTQLEKDEEALEKLVSDILSKEREFVEEIRKQPKAINHLVGKIVKETKGRYDSRRIVEMLRREIEKRS